MEDSPPYPGRKSAGKQRGNNKLSKKLAPLEDVPSGQLSNSMSSTKSITHKKDLIEAVRRTNPASVTTAPNIFWDVEGSLKTSNIDDSDVKQQMTIVENGVNYNIKRYNDLRVINERLTRALKSRLDELDNQKKQFETLDAMKKAETEEARRIEMLQREAARCEEEISEKTHYARKLEHMLNRLKTNQLKFDAHMVGMEDTMKNIQKDGVEVRLMRRGLDAGLAKAALVLEETKMNLSVSRKDREVLMAQRKQEYVNAKVLAEWLKQRERMKIELGIELRGDLTLEEEKYLKQQIDEKLEKTNNLRRAADESNKKLQQMEDAFEKLRSVTCVEKVDEMHEKFSMQKTNKMQLELEVKDAEHRLATCKKQNQKLEIMFQELKSSGGGQAELNRESINKLEEAYNDARNEQKMMKADHERIALVLLGLKQGAAGLAQRIQPYLNLADGGVFDLTQVGEDRSPWTETVDALTNAEHVLTKMQEAISGDNTNANAGGTFDDDDDDHSAYSRDTQSIETKDEAPDHALNVRIKSRKYLRDVETGLRHEDDHGASADLLDNSYDLSPNGGIGGPTGGEHGHGHDDVDQKADVDPTVPSRQSVKMSSLRKSHEAKRKQDMDIRRKRLTDRMEGRVADGAAGRTNRSHSHNAGSGAAADDGGIAATAKLKAQKVSADRLSVGHKVPTLPDGVTLRDDPMTKTIAFLNSHPKLT